MSLVSLAFVTPLIAGHLTWRKISTGRWQKQPLLVFSLLQLWLCDMTGAWQRDSCDDRYEAGRMSDIVWCLPLVTMRADWSLTNHQRLGAPVSSPGARSSLDALRPGCCARTARAGSGPALAHPSRHNKLDFSSFRGEKRRAWACGESSKCYAHVTRQTETVLTSGDIWNHLSSVGLFRNDGWMGGYCQTFQQCRRQSINLLNQSRDRSVSKKLSALWTESIHPDTHVTRDSSDLTSQP